jgi:integrase
MALDFPRENCLSLLMPRTPQIKPVKVKGRPKPWMISIPPALSQSGNRERKFFESKEAAEAEADRITNRHRTHGEMIDRISADQLRDALRAYELLDESGVVATLPAIVEEHIRNHKARTASVTFLALFNEFLQVKQDRNPQYIRELTITRDRWPQLHPLIVSDLNGKDLAPLIAKLSPGARNPILRYWRAVFNLGVRRGYLTNNPTASLDFERRKRREVETLTVEQVKKMLEHALAEDLQLLPFLVLGCFAGVRPDGELQKLEWSDITGKTIVVRPEVSKTNRRRFVDLSDNAIAWLSEYRQRGGAAVGPIVTFTDRELQGHRQRNWKTAGIKRWIQQGMRHTYCSNWLAMYEDVNKLVLQSGHDSVDTMWRNYHKGTPKAEAEKYWAIRPPKQAGSTIVPFKAA